MAILMSNLQQQGSNASNMKIIIIVLCVGGVTSIQAIIKVLIYKNYRETFKLFLLLIGSGAALKLVGTKVDMQHCHVVLDRLH